jgi:type I restriction enzyme, S subunit
VKKWDPRQSPDVAFDYIDIGGIDVHRIVSVNRLVGAEAPSRARQIVRADDTILSTVRTYLVKTALVPSDLDRATASTGFCVLRPTMAIDPGFLFYRVIESGFVVRLTARQTGSSYPAVRDTDVFEQPIALPPLAEQRRIVAAIEEQLSRLDSAQKLLHSTTWRLEALAASMIEAIRAPVRRLGDVLVDLRYGTSTKCGYDGAGAPVLRIPNVRNRGIDLTDLKCALDPSADVGRVLVGDILFIRTNGSRDLIGRAAVVGKDAAGMGFASYLIRARVEPDAADPGFLALVLSGRRLRAEIEARAATTAGQYNLGRGAINEFQVPLPPIDEQRRIRLALDEQLATIEDELRNVVIARRRGEALRRAILARAFRGELVPQDPHDEPASLLLERIAAERAAAGNDTSGRRRRRATIEAL